MEKKRYIWISRWELSWGYPYTAMNRTDRAKYELFAKEVDDLLPSCNDPAAIGLALQKWSDNVDKAVDATLRAQHAADPVRHPTPFLPKVHRGRCRAIKPVRRQLPVLLKPGREGDFQPDVEVSTVRGRQKAKQARRLQTFCQGLATASVRGALSDPAVATQLFNEWQAILRAPGYSPSFVEWTLEGGLFLHIPSGFPWVGLCQGPYGICQA